MRELKVGEELRIRCVEDKPRPSIRKKNHNRSVKSIPSRCSKCVFNGSKECPFIMCGESDRGDGKNVHFELVEE